MHDGHPSEYHWLACKHGVRWENHHELQNPHSACHHWTMYSSSLPSSLNLHVQICLPSLCIGFSDYLQFSQLKQLISSPIWSRGGISPFRSAVSKLTSIASTNWWFGTTQRGAICLGRGEWEESIRITYVWIRKGLHFQISFVEQIRTNVFKIVSPSPPHRYLYSRSRNYVVVLNCSQCVRNFRIILLQNVLGWFKPSSKEAARCAWATYSCRL